MSKIDDGGPAYPRVIHPAGEVGKIEYPGMSVRMWLAGQFHASLLKGGFNLDPSEGAKLALQHADALIAEGRKACPRTK